TYSNDGDVTGNHGNDDYWLVKLDATGNMLWQKTLGGSGQDNASSIQQTVDGGYIISGYSYSNNGDVTGNHGNADYWIVKTDALGNIQWQKSLGGSNLDFAVRINETSDGGYIVAGTSYSSNGDIISNHGNADYWIVKLNTVGSIEWQKALGGSNYDETYSILQTSDEGYIVAGRTRSNNYNVTGNHGDEDFWIVKLSPETLGTNISLYPYKIVANCYPANAISCTMKNNAKAVVVKLYRYGVLLDSALNVTDHTGFTNLPCGDYYATATDENGNISFSKEVQIVPTPINTTTTNITSTKAQLNWTGFECPDDYLIEFRIQGNTEWIQKAPGNVHNFVLDRLLPATTYVWRVASEKRVNGIKATGRFSDSLTFTTEAVAKMPNNALSITLNSNQLIVSPNPAKNYFVINFKDQIQEKVNAILYNENGKAVWNSGLVNASSLNNKTTNTTSLARGVYYLKLTDENGRIISAAKVIIAN
ncbi:MAG TPA: T9SS type A sorting domain-containing protein, partial [Parafilimonas sp.]|nr:T9SS type A sorting domain-containing protein [Parafilimonas sp.]